MAQCVNKILYEAQCLRRLGQNFFFGGGGGIWISQVISEAFLSKQVAAAWITT